MGTCLYVTVTNPIGLSVPLLPRPRLGHAPELVLHFAEGAFQTIAPEDTPSGLTISLKRSSGELMASSGTQKNQDLHANVTSKVFGLRSQRCHNHHSRPRDTVGIETQILTVVRWRPGRPWPETGGGPPPRLAGAACSSPSPPARQWPATPRRHGPGPSRSPAFAAGSGPRPWLPRRDPRLGWG